MSGLNWFWIGLGAAVPPLIALPLAWLIWRKQQPILGNIAGSSVIFGFGLALIMREHVELDAAVQDCLERGVPCWPEPSAFARFAIYAFIALIQVMVLFSVSIKVEQRMRRREYAPEWR